MNITASANATCTCPHCAGLITFAAHQQGQETACPHCRESITLPVIDSPAPATSAPQGLACPFCQSPGEFIASRDITGGGWVAIVVGFLLCLTLLGALIGLPMLLVGLSTRAQKYTCCNCGKTF